MNTECPYDTRKEIPIVRTSYVRNGEHERKDRLAGEPCKSTNGAYLEGWYSIASWSNVHIAAATRKA